LRQDRKTVTEGAAVTCLYNDFHQ